MYKSLIRPLLFLVDPEKIHHFTFSFLKFSFKIPFVKSIASGLFDYRHPVLHRNVFGLDFQNPVGLAAGFDKDARLVDELAAFGFGFIEIGTLTPKPQEGNPKPRLFRLPEDQGLINRMGFNNEGVEAAALRLKKWRSRHPHHKVMIGGNIGKNKVTPNEEAVGDYEKAFEVLYDVVDYFVVNVSSPNTPNLRELQEKEPLTRLLQVLQQKNSQQRVPKPILLKIAPDLTDSQLDDIIDIVQQTRIDGVIATNTTISRAGLHTKKSTVDSIGVGGLSGKPLKNRATEVIRYLHQKSNGKLVIIGVGGIYTAEDVIEKLEAGATLVQVYTGFIYEGAGIVKRINKKLAAYFSKQQV